ncbi:polyadenylate-binding protein-interacting protein 1 [Anabrus simplex]|uniref:polyadenylate-binding protein-interacting protein 1 n=1 Tax=Anabrus simplex TaxID=316456 RepID=UPI0034DD14CE
MYSEACGDRVVFVEFEFKNSRLEANMKPAGDIHTPRGRGRSPWRQGQDLGELRRPHSASTNAPGLAAPDPGAGGDAPKKTTLSPDAKEFFPKGYSSQQFEDSPGPGGDAGPPQYHSIIPSQEPFKMNHLYEVMHSLTLNPGRFDAVIEPLTNKFGQYNGDMQMVQDVVNAIVHQSILEPNFRYNGARLCVFLQNASSPDVQQCFRNCLLCRCQDENSIVPILVNSCPQRVHGYTLFLAELYIQMDDSRGSNARIPVLGIGLFGTLLTLVSVATAENLKYACQALKLAGFALDKQDPISMNRLFESLSIAPSLCPESNNVHYMVNSVLHLRQCGWGNPSAAPQADDSLHQTQPLNEPVFYGPDGQILTAEEHRFLQDNVASVPETEDYDDYGENGETSPADEEEEDEEFEAAYEEFLKISNQTTKT